MMIKIKIPIRFDGLNTVISKSKRHWSEYSRLKKTYTDAVVKIVKAHGIEPAKKYPVTVEMTWLEPNKRRDPDNIASAKKIVIDGLVKAGTIGGDGWAYINKFIDRFVIDKDVGVEVVIR